MMRLACPNCGDRDEIEFTCGGQAHIERPTAPGTLSDSEWGQYLFMRQNPKGLHHERWCHTYGCNVWFNVERDTATHKISKVYAITGAMGGAND